MRPATQIDPVALGIERDFNVARQILDQLRLVFLALGLEEADGVLAVHSGAHEGGIAGDDVLHLRLDGGEILWREGLVTGEIVIEPVLDRRAYSDLRAGEKRLHGFGHDVGGVVADQFQRIRVPAGDENDVGIVRDFRGDIDQLAVQLHRQGGAGEAGADGGGHRRAGDGRVERTHGTVGQGDGGHGQELRGKRNRLCSDWQVRGNPVHGQVCQIGGA